MDKETYRRMEAAFDRQLLDAVENGIPALKGGEPIILEGEDGTPKPLMIPPGAAMMNVIRQRLEKASHDDVSPDDLSAQFAAAAERRRQREEPFPTAEPDDDELG